MTISLEFMWQAKSKYWAGEITVIDLYVDNQLRYTIDIPQGDNKSAEAIPLPFRKYGFSRFERKVDYLIIKHLDTTQKITLKAGIFNQKEGNTLTRNSDGSWSRDIRFTREDIPVSLDLSSLKLGNHYKIIATHIGEGSELDTIIEKNGLSKKDTISQPSIPPASFFNASSSSEAHHREEPSDNPRVRF